jgi:hypothetical protein
MDISKRFHDAVSSRIIRINSLENDRKYSVVQSEQVVTKFGPTVLLSIKDSPYSIVKSFVPKQYSCVITDEDVASINAQRVKLNLISKGHGKCQNRTSHVLKSDVYHETELQDLLQLTTER